MKSITQMMYDLQKELGAVKETLKNQIDPERIAKLEGEIRAMKARMGKQQKEESPDDRRRNQGST